MTTPLLSLAPPPAVPNCRLGKLAPSPHVEVPELAQRRACPEFPVKQAVDMAFDMPGEEAVQASLHLSQRAFESADCREGVRAFFAKERPRFTHR